MDYKLEEIIDIPLFQTLQEKLNLIYSFPSAIIDNDGKVLTSVAWQDVCIKFHRVHPECEKECIKSDIYILEHLQEANPAVSYKCPHGLIDNATPIIIDGKHLGNFFTGQFFLEKPDLSYFKTQAAKYGFKEGEYLEAVEKVPIWTKEKLDLYLDFIKGFIDIIANIGVKNLNEFVTNKALKESEERYRILNEQSPIAIEHYNKEGLLIDVNPACLNLFGVKDIKEVLHFNLFEDPNLSEEIKIKLNNKENVHFQAMFDFEKVKELKLYNTTKSGTAWLNTTISILTDNDGGLKGYLVYITDITEQKNADEKANRLGKYYKAIIEKATDSVILLDAIGNFKYVSPNALKIFGYEETEFLSYNPAELTHPDDLEMVLSELKKLLQDNTYIFTLQYRFKAKNDTWKWVETTFRNLLADENVNSIVLNSHDITERKIGEEEILKAKEKSEDSEMQQKALLENAIFPISIVRMNGVIIFYNDATRKLFGIKEYQSKNLSMLDFWRYPEQRKALVDELTENGFVINFEAEAKTTDKEYKTILVSSRLITFNREQVIFSTYNDITERKLLENSLRKAKIKAEESDRLKSAFLANMSHEIRTPMNGILGFTELLKEPHLADDKQSDYIDIIEKSGHRLLNLINNIIDLSKIESGQMKVNLSDVNLNEILEFALNFFLPEAAKKNIKLHLKNTLAEKEIIFTSDKEKLFGIFTNLVKNAIKFTERGSIEIGYNIKESFFIFYIKDTGIGIPIDRQKAVFERFTHADIENKKAFQGAGLGLSIAKAYVEMLGGKLWVESKLEKGSTFYFTLPYNPIKEKASVVTETIILNQVTDIITKKIKILIAEDDDTSFILLNTKLKSLDIAIIRAKNGRDAIETVKNNSDIDLILMDIKMPIIDGYQATKEIRTFNTDVVIIAQTAFALMGDKEKAIDVGCNNYITKPIDIDLLLALIHKYFG